MSEVQSHHDPRLTLPEHLSQIRAAAAAIWNRHTRTLLRESAQARDWFEDGVTLHDAGKASRAFQTYIADPKNYRALPDTKAHTPLSTFCALRYAAAEGWEWRRALAVALIAAGHHSEFKTGDELNKACSMDHIIGMQIRDLDWAALDSAIGIVVPRPGTADAVALCSDAGDYLQDELLESLGRLEIADALAYRLRCQLAFSVLLEADKAFLAVPAADLSDYLAPRQARLPPTLVDDFLASKPAAAINSLRADARRAMLEGLLRAAGRRVQTMTLPTGTGKTLLAATWALKLREEIARTERAAPLVVIVLPFLSIIDQTVEEYVEMFKGCLNAGEMITYHSLSDQTYDADLEDKSQDFFLDTWQSDVVLTTFDQLLYALLSPKARHQMRFHHLADALIVFDEVQALPCVLWDPVRRVLDALTQLGTTHVLAMSATQPGFLQGACELIAKPEEFFGKMARYRLVLRHRTPQKLSEFIAECKARLPNWAGKRVLLTLNTRRSARTVRDALAAALNKVATVIFLSTDVTLRDRRKAIRRIKRRERFGRPCLVVSTQCIEAGVDVDMDLVIRDFAPLDSLVQVAGRCNRHNLRPRGVGEVVSLREDDVDREFAGMVYTDKISLDATRAVLGNRSEVDEEDVFPLTRHYFNQLALKKDTGAKITVAITRWEEIDSTARLLRGAQRPQISFVVTREDPGLRAALDAIGTIRDRWERRRAYRRLARRVAENTVAVYERPGLDPAVFADPFPANKTGDGVWFWFLRPEFYQPKRGIDLGAGGEAEPDSWGMII